MNKTVTTEELIDVLTSTVSWMAAHRIGGSCAEYEHVMFKAKVVLAKARANEQK
jgi:hypothetical protein